eukprot:gene11059-3128_t
MDEPKSPARQRHAEKISLGELSGTHDGRRVSYDTRMAMQRELDSARTQLRAAERQMDELRRQSAASREETSLYRSEISRLQDELRSCRERLNAALDSQQDLIGKNAHKHKLLVDLQAQVSSLREELSDKNSQIQSLEDRLSRTRTEVEEVRARSSSSEKTLDLQLSSVQADLSVARERLSAANAENDSLRATVEALRAELRNKEASAYDLETTAHGLENDRAHLRDEVSRAQERASRLQDELDRTRHQLQTELTSVRAQLSSAEAHLEVFKNNEAHLHDRLASKDKLISELQSGKTKAEVELSNSRGEWIAKERSYEGQIEALKERERVLADDLKQLHRYIGRKELSAPTAITSSNRYDDAGYGSRSTVVHRPAVETTTTISRPLGSSTYRYSTEPYEYSTTRTVIERPYMHVDEALNASRRARRLLHLSQERDEAERLASAARARFNNSLRADY